MRPKRIAQPSDQATLGPVNHKVLSLVPLTIRRAVPDEAARLGAFAAELFRASYGPTHPEPTLSRYLTACFAAEVMRHRLEDPRRIFLVVGTDGGDWSGYAELRRGACDPSCMALTQPLPDGEAVEIVRFYVDTEHHG